MRFFETVFAEKKVKLDVVDKKLLRELSMNARNSCSSIAKKIGTSRDTVHYRLQNLKKSGVLQGFRTLVDISKFGFVNVHVFLQLKQPSKEVFSVLIKKLKSYNFIRAIIQFNGKYDLELAVVAKDIGDCDRVVSQVTNECHEFLLNYEIAFITRTFVANIFPKSFLDFTVHEAKKPKKEEACHDEVDIQILELLSEQADLQVYKIAEKVNLSGDAVTYRIKKLQNAGYILGYIPAINYNLINYNIHSILVSITHLSAKDESALQEFLQMNRDVLWAVKAFGKYNLILYICTQKMDEFIKTTEEIRQYLTNKIKDYETLINFEEYKYTYFPQGLVIIK